MKPRTGQPAHCARTQVPAWVRTARIGVLIMRAAIWARVSTDKQDETNQIPALENYCAAHGYEITRRYVLSDVSASNGAHKTTLRAMFLDAQCGDFDVLVVWALDRIRREGIEELLRIVRELREQNVRLVGLQEPWCGGSDAVTELLLSIVGWVAQMESQRHSERVKAAMARRRAEGKPMGGAASHRGKDRKPRKTDGYAKAWKRRRAIQERAASESTASDT
jgi:DNA invertase Pin-like site-specific DNA recombinase